jgi:hypothetical protein
VSVFVHRAFQLRADDAALVIRQRDGGLDLQLSDELTMHDCAIGAGRMAQHFVPREARRIQDMS